MSFVWDGILDLDMEITVPCRVWNEVLGPGGNYLFRFTWMERLLNWIDGGFLQQHTG